MESVANPAVLPRAHAADLVFEALAARILRGELAPGASLPPERLIGDELGVSRPIVRQAVHRLAELGLVSVRQGGATQVRDPHEAADLRVLDLLYRLGPATAQDVLDFTERQVLNGHLLLYMAERRATPDDRRRLVALLDEFSERGALDDELHRFEEGFWREVARLTGNRICVLEANWWFKLLAVQPRAEHPMVAPSAIRAVAFRQLARRIEQGDGAAFYLQLATRMIEQIELQLRTAPRRPRAKPGSARSSRATPSNATPSRATASRPNASSESVSQALPSTAKASGAKASGVKTSGVKAGRDRTSAARTSGKGGATSRRSR